MVLTLTSRPTSRSLFQEKKTKTNRMYTTTDDEEESEDDHPTFHVGGRNRMEEEERRQERLLSRRHGEAEEESPSSKNNRKRARMDEQQLEQDLRLTGPPPTSSSTNDKAAVPRPRARRPKLEATDVVKGLTRIRHEFPTFLTTYHRQITSRQKGAEAAYGRALMRQYRQVLWETNHSLPVATDDVVHRFETLGSKADVRSYLQAAREEHAHHCLDRAYGPGAALRMQQALQDFQRQTNTDKKPPTKNDNDDEDETDPVVQEEVSAVTITATTTATTTIVGDNTKDNDSQSERSFDIGREDLVMTGNDSPKVRPNDIVLEALVPDSSEPLEEMDVDKESKDLDADPNLSQLVQDSEPPTNAVPFLNDETDQGSTTKVNNSDETNMVPDSETDDELTVAHEPVGTPRHQESPSMPPKDTDNNGDDDDEEEEATVAYNDNDEEATVAYDTVREPL